MSSHVGGAILVGSMGSVGTASPIWELYPIIQKITSYLDPPSLCAVERLTRNWASLVARERLNRSTGPVLYDIHNSSVTSNDDSDDYREKRKRRRGGDANKTISLDNYLRDNLDCSDPCLILLFTKTDSVDSILTDDLSATISQMFTKDTQVASIISSDGIVGTTWQSKEIQECQRISSGQDPNVITSYLVFPRRREFGVSLLSSDHQEAPANTRLVLLFQSPYPRRKSGKRVRLSPFESTKNADSDIWYVGGITYRTHVFQSNEAKFIACNHVGIAFYGLGLRVFNCVLPSNLVAAVDIQNELSRFKSDIDLSFRLKAGRCAAIACICCMRGINMHMLADVEADLFKEIFPEVPLVGCFTGGEISICCDKFVPLDGRVSNSDLMGFSSVIVILAW